jgi:predicted methyltransferase
MQRAATVISRTLFVLLALTPFAFAAGGGALPAYITAAISDSARPAEDTARDAARKPGETMLFAGVKPGMKILELAAGKGYYTRLLSAAVGPSGKIYTTSAAPQPDKPPPAVQLLAADPHYANLQVVIKKLADPLVLPEKVDMVWTTQNYHDFHNLTELDMATVNKRSFDALKSGGIYFILDHSAEKGSGARDTNTLHRIDEDTVKQEVEAAGFKFVGESNILRNKDDPRTAKVFDPSIQGHTDQFLLKFVKP